MDYLKKVKRRGRRRVVVAVAVTVLVLALGIAAKLFLIGSPANWDTWENYNFTARTNVPNQLDISFYPDELPDTAYCHWNVTNENGIVCVSARKVLPRFSTIPRSIGSIFRSAACGRSGWQTSWSGRAAS